MGFLKSFWEGTKIGFGWQMKLIRESKWYLIPFAIDIIFYVPKLIVVLVLMTTEKGRNFLVRKGEEMTQVTEGD